MPLQNHSGARGRWGARGEAGPAAGATQGETRHVARRRQRPRSPCLRQPARPHLALHGNRRGGETEAGEGEGLRVRLTPPATARPHLPPTAAPPPPPSPPALKRRRRRRRPAVDLETARLLRHGLTTRPPPGPKPKVWEEERREGRAAPGWHIGRTRGWARAARRERGNKRGISAVSTDATAATFFQSFRSQKIYNPAWKVTEIYI